MKKICLVTNWYPTEENPFVGNFFREQALAMSNYADFVVLHYQFTEAFFVHKTKLELINKERNIAEYRATMQAGTLDKCVRKAFSLNKMNYHHFLLDETAELLKNENIDIFYTVTAQSEAAICARFANYYGKPYVVSEHGPFPWVGSTITQENRKAMEEANAFLAISNDKIRQVLMQDTHISNIHYVGNMVDDEVFVLEPSQNKTKTFIAVGSNSFYKNYPMLIESFNRLVELTDIPFKLVIAGYQANKGYAKDSKQLEEKLKNSKFSERLELIPSVPHSEMPKLYAKADAFIMTSIQEGQPVSAIEAGCCGLPIFATRCGGIEDYVDEKIGRIVSILDADGLAMCLKEFLEKPDLYDAGYIREQVKKRFGKKAFVQNMIDAFESV